MTEKSEAEVIEPLYAADVPVRVRGHDINMVRELLGLSAADLSCLIGKTPGRSWRVTGEEGKAPIDNPALALLVRMLLEFHDVAPVFPKPAPEKVARDLYTHGKAVLDKKNVSVTSKPERFGRALGLLFGTSGWTGTQWLRHGKPPNIITLRLMLLFELALNAYGPEAVERFLALVEAEARSRGIDGLEELLSSKAAGWEKQVDPPGHEEVVSKKRRTARKRVAKKKRTGKKVVKKKASTRKR